jgi:hypothetical protein
MFGFFSWIRGKTKTAVLAGVADALADLGPTDDSEAAVARLRAKLAGRLLAPPAKEVEGLDLELEAREAGIDLERLEAGHGGNGDGDAKPGGRRKKAAS